jgi:hypothetical protein
MAALQEDETWDAASERSTAASNTAAGAAAAYHLCGEQQQFPAFSLDSMQSAGTGRGGNSYEQTPLPSSPPRPRSQDQRDWYHQQQCQPQQYLRSDGWEDTYRHQLHQRQQQQQQQQHSQSLLSDELHQQASHPWQAEAADDTGRFYVSIGQGWPATASPATAAGQPWAPGTVAAPVDLRYPSAAAVAPLQEQRSLARGGSGGFAPLDAIPTRQAHLEPATLSLHAEPSEPSNDSSSRSSSRSSIGPFSLRPQTRYACNPACEQQHKSRQMHYV